MKDSCSYYYTILVQCTNIVVFKGHLDTNTPQAFRSLLTKGKGKRCIILITLKHRLEQQCYILSLAIQTKLYESIHYRHSSIFLWLSRDVKMMYPPRTSCPRYPGDRGRRTGPTLTQHLCLTGSSSSLAVKLWSLALKRDWWAMPYLQQIILGIQLMLYTMVSLHYYRVCVSSKFDQFLPLRFYFVSKRPENFVRIAKFPYAAFGPLFAFHCPLFVTKNNNLGWNRHRRFATHRNMQVQRSRPTVLSARGQ